MISRVLKQPARILYALFFLLVGSVLAFAIFRPIQVLPRITLAPGLSLTDQNSARLTNEDLRGHVVLYNFTYSNCTGACQQTSNVMRAVQDHLSEVNAGDIPISLVTISFDPERDTPERLRAYATQVGADPSRWRIATGDATRLKYALGGGFDLYYAPNPDGTSPSIRCSSWSMAGASFAHLTKRRRLPRIDSCGTFVSLSTKRAIARAQPSMRTKPRICFCVIHRKARMKNEG